MLVCCVAHSIEDALPNVQTLLSKPFVIFLSMPLLTCNFVTWRSLSHFFSVGIRAGTLQYYVVSEKITHNEMSGVVNQPTLAPRALSTVQTKFDHNEKSFLNDSDS